MYHGRSENSRGQRQLVASGVNRREEKKDLERGQYRMDQIQKEPDDLLRKPMLQLAIRNSEYVRGSRSVTLIGLDKKWNGLSPGQE